MLLALLLSACVLTSDDEGPKEESGPEPVDFLFVVDNSESMQAEATALAGALDELDAAVADAGVGEWHAGVTTTSVYFDDGATADVDEGEAGTLVGGTTVDDVDALREALLCHATCWDANMPSDPGYTCGDPLSGDVSEEYLDCLCGPRAWQDHCGTGTEQGLEAVYMAMCRAADTPPAACSEFPENAAVVFDDGAIGTNTGLDAGRTMAIVVTDEGDSSPRTTSGDSAIPGDVEVVADAYTVLYADLAVELRVSVLGPAWDGSDGSCLDAAQQWGVERYQLATRANDGVYEPLTDASADCAPRAMSELVASAAARAFE